MNKRLIKEKEAPKTVSKEELLNDLKKVACKFEKEGLGNIYDITRDYYRNNGKFSERQYTKIFPSFPSFKSALIDEEGIDIENFEQEKKLIVLEEENKRLNRERTALLKQSIDEEKILNIYKQKKITINIPKALKLTKVTKVNATEGIEGIAMISDVHAGEIVEPEELNNINEYNLSIMKDRLDRIFYYLTYFCKKFNVTKLHLFFLGDLISGCHHDDLARTNELDDVSVTFYLQEYLVTKILEIESHFSSINIEVLVGNHSRIPEGKPQWKTSVYLNYEYILAKQMQLHFDLLQKNEKNKKININISPSLFKIVTVAERKFFLTHGHILSNGSNSFAGLPYYNLSMSSGKLFGNLSSADSMLDMEFSDILCGHLHISGRVKIPSGNLYLNGSIIGTNQFGMFKTRSISEPEQTLLLVSKGKVISEFTLKGNDF